MSLSFAKIVESGGGGNDGSAGMVMVLVGSRLVGRWYKKGVVLEQGVVSGGVDWKSITKIY